MTDTIRGQPLPIQTVQPGFILPQHIIRDTAWTDQPPNADFGAWLNGSGSPPDYWSMLSGTWGTDAVRDGSAPNTFDGLFSINVDANGKLQSDPFPIKPSTDYLIEVAFKNDDGATDILPELQLLDSTKATQVQDAFFSPATPASGTWSRQAFRLTPISTARFGRLRFTASAGGSVKHIWCAFLRANEIRTQESWQNVGGGGGAPTFADANWSNFGGGYAPCRYRKNLNGEVTIQGTITTAVLRAAGATIFTLPAHYCPAYNLQPTCKIYTGGADTAQACYVLSSGAVQIGHAMNANDNVSLSLTFPAEQ